MKINVLTLFPESVKPILNSSMLQKAQEKKLLEIEVYNIRDYADNKHKKTDDYPFGGGAGMVLMAQPIFDAIKKENLTNTKMIYMSPRGMLMDQNKLEAISKESEITVLCGHYEGVDQRVLDYFDFEEISIGDYILTGGEIAACALIDGAVRLLPGVLASEESAFEESIYSGLLEHDQYTKPRDFEGMTVPEVLTNGNHQLIKKWREENSIERTKEIRPDLFEKYKKRKG